MAKSRKLSPSMVKVLDNLIGGLCAGDHCRGQAQFGGLHGTLMALIQRGLITVDHKVTKAGHRTFKEIAKWQTPPTRPASKTTRGGSI